MSKVTIAGSLKPFRPGQKVVVRFFNNARQIRSRVVNVSEGDGNYGSFKASIHTRMAGRYAAQATYYGKRGGDPISADSTIRKSWGVRFKALEPGQCGRVVRAFRQALNDLAMVPSKSRCFDGKMQRAVLAYRKLNDIGRSPVASRSVVRRIFNREGGYRVRKPELGNHMESPLSKQVLVFAKGSRPYAIFPIASGAPVTPTILGTYSVYRKDPGYNSLGMYYSTYFIRGYAIHGFRSVPDYPASHGCLRTFIADQPRVYDLTFIGQPISALLAQTGADARRVACTVRSDAPIWFDAGNLRQVLLNLVGNALRHASDARGAVEIDWGPDPSGRLSLIVADDGPGVPASSRIHLFEPFFTTEARGTGLGLHLARELCTANGATIRYRPVGADPPLRSAFVVEPAIRAASGR